MASGIVEATEILVLLGYVTKWLVKLATVTLNGRVYVVSTIQLAKAINYLDKTLDLI